MTLIEKFSHKGRSYVFGSPVWYTLGRDTNIAKSIRQSLNDNRRHLVCIRHDRHQYSVIPDAIGKNRFERVYSAAATIAQALPGQLLACWPLPGKGMWYLLAIQSDGIMMDGDRLFYIEEEAREAFNRLHTGSTFRRVVAPETWNIEGSTSIPLDGLLKPGPDYRHFSTISSHINTTIKIAFASGGVAVISWYFLIYQTRNVDSYNQPLQAQSFVEYVPLSTALSICGQSITKSMGAIQPGFRLDRLTCNGKTIKTFLMPQTSYPQLALKIFPPRSDSLSLSVDGKEISFSQPIGALKSIQRSQGWPAVNDITRKLTSISEMLRSTISISTIENLPIDPASEQVPTFARIIRWNISATVPPIYWNLPDDIQATSVLTNITYHPESRQYKIEATTYVDP